MTVKTLVLQFVVTGAAFGVRVLRRAGKTSRFGLVVPADPGSAGDLAMIRGAISALAAGGRLTPRLYHTTRVADWWPGAGIDGFNAEMTLRFLSWRRALRFLWSLRDAAEFAVVGADIMDGAYSEQVTLARLGLLTLAARAGIKARLIGFSFAGPSSPRIAEAYRALPAGVRLLCRDPVSRDRLQALTGRPVELAADLAFLLEPATLTTPGGAAAEWCTAERAAGRRIVAVTANQWLGDHLAAGLASAFGRAVLALAEADPALRFLLIPHDSRMDEADACLLGEIMNQLPEAVAARCRLIPKTPPAEAVKALMGEVEMLLSARMHACIAALGRGTPVACATYLGKFEGLMAHFGLEGNLVAPAEIGDEGGARLAEVALQVYRRRAADRVRIERRLPGIRALALANLA